MWLHVPIRSPSISPKNGLSPYQTHQVSQLLWISPPPPLFELRRTDRRSSARRLLRLARKHNFRVRMRQINTTGKSLLIFGNRVKSRYEKYSASLLGQISALGCPSHPKRGGSRSSRTCGGMRWTRIAAQDERRETRTAKSRGPDIPTLISSLSRLLQAMVPIKPGHQEEHEGNR